MSVWRAVGWVLLAALVVLILGAYVMQWYRQQVSSSLDRWLGDDPAQSDPGGAKIRAPVAVSVAASRPITAEEQDLLAMDTGYVDDDEEA